MRKIFKFLLCILAVVLLISTFFIIFQHISIAQKTQQVFANTLNSIKSTSSSFTDQNYNYLINCIDELSEQQNNSQSINIINLIYVLVTSLVLGICLYIVGHIDDRYASQLEKIEKLNEESLNFLTKHKSEVALQSVKNLLYYDYILTMQASFSYKKDNATVSECISAYREFYLNINEIIEMHNPENEKNKISAFTKNELLTVLSRILDRMKVIRSDSKNSGFDKTEIQQAETLEAKLKKYKTF